MSSQFPAPLAPRLSAKRFPVAAVIMAVIFAISAASAWSNDRQRGDLASPITQITDQMLLDWTGQWQGHCHVNSDSMPIEIEWKLTDDGQWIRGEFKIWSDFKKNTPVHNEIIFIRPAETAGNYKAVAIGNDGLSRTGRALLRDREWSWTWTYDNGNVEKGKLIFFAQGEIMYDATVTDAGGATIKTLDYDITRPYMTRQGR